MRKCAVCGKQSAEKAILFMPSNVFVFLCYPHMAKVLREKPGEMPIKEWVKTEKAKHESMQYFIKSIAKSDFEDTHNG